MTPEERARMKQWVETWKRAGPELEKIREEELKEVHTPTAVEAFAGMALQAVRNFPPGPTSGLVEQQRWFMKAAGRGR